MPGLTRKARRTTWRRELRAPPRKASLRRGPSLGQALRRGKRRGHDFVPTALLVRPGLRQASASRESGSKLSILFGWDLEVVQPGGVEPPTYRSVVCRSIQLSYGCTVRPPCGGRIVGQQAAGRKPRRPNLQQDTQAANSEPLRLGEEGARAGRALRGPRPAPLPSTRVRRLSMSPTAATKGSPSIR